MKRGKQIYLVLFLIGLTLFLSISFISAGLIDDIEKWFKDAFGKGITGKASHLPCTDSDIYITEQRLRHYVKGYVETPNGTFWDHCSGFVNYDYHCSIGSDTVSAFTTTITCPYQCTDGACIDEELCTDSDGVNYNLKGEVKLSFVNGSSRVFSTDYCDSSTRLSERTCIGITPAYEYYDCPNGCSNGACSSSSSTNTTNTSTLKTCSQQYGYTFTPSTHACYGTTLNASDTSCCSQPPTSLCSTNKVSACITSGNCTTVGGNWCNGVCQSTTCSSTSGNYSTCSDTDGLYYFEKGQLTLPNGTYVDYCKNANDLVEYYCYKETDKSPSFVTTTCSKGCSNGACVEICFDSDRKDSVEVEAGSILQSSFIKGYVTNTISNETFWDYCSNNLNVVEYYCWSGATSYVSYNCNKGCSNGACISDGTTTTTPITTTPSTTAPSQSTTPSSGAGSGGGGGGGGFVGGYYVPRSYEEYKSEQESTYIDERGREVTIKTKTETKNGRTEVEETRTFIDEKGNKIEIKTEIEIESSEEGTEVKRKIKTKDGGEIIFKTKTEVEDGKEKTTESINIRGAEFMTRLPVKEEFEEGEAKLKAKLSTGINQEIIAKPDDALQTALNELGSTNNFVFELKEVGEGDEVKAVFSAKAEKLGKFLGIFSIEINLETLVDTETGDIIETKKPWWSFLVAGIKKEEKAVVCHVSEDEDDKKTIEIAVSAVKAHLAHGDTIGECSDEKKEEEVEQPDLNQTINETILNETFVNETEKTENITIENNATNVSI